MKTKESDAVKPPLPRCTETVSSIEFANLAKDYYDAMYKVLGDKIREAALTFDDDKDLGRQAFMILRSFLNALGKDKFGEL